MNNRLIPDRAVKHQTLESILAQKCFTGYTPCKIPVTSQFLMFFSEKIASSGVSYLIVHKGYVHGHSLSHQQLETNINAIGYESIKNWVLKKRYLLIQSEKRETAGSGLTYYRIHINRTRAKTAGAFVNVLKQFDITIDLRERETTDTWKGGDSEDESSFMQTAAGAAAQNLADALRELQARRRRNDKEMEELGATIVLIPDSAKFEHYRPYIRQSLEVEMDINAESLHSIFTHRSELHDGAVFAHRGKVIAVRCFFRVTSHKKRERGIHGTRHASAAEFSRHAMEHRPLTFVLSEEDGKIRSIINGEMAKIECEDIPKLIRQHHFTKKHSSGPSNVSKGNEKDADESKVSSLPSDSEGRGTDSGSNDRTAKNDDGGIQIVTSDDVKVNV